MNSSLIALIGLSFFLGCGCWLFFLWAVQKGEFSDMERPKHRMLDDDDAPMPPPVEADSPPPHAPQEHELTLSLRAHARRVQKERFKAVPHR